MCVIYFSKSQNDEKQDLFERKATSVHRLCVDERKILVKPMYVFTHGTMHDVFATQTIFPIFQKGIIGTVKNINETLENL